uniref:Uncharacterized protein n=1 Tax=Nicotiana tabacum TaxID=4097 RepID=A0A1S4BRC5_TOBAC|nr:PREDICTED: uncharacterized protein LOC107811080 [Nicotiana tabacum]
MVANGGCQFSTNGRNLKNILRLLKTKSAPISLPLLFSEAYQNRLEESRQSQLDYEDGRSTQVSLNYVASIWTQLVGGAKKGRTYGLGSQHSVGRSTILLSGDASYSQNHEEVEALRKEVEELKEERKEDHVNFNKLQSIVEKFMRTSI